jgi:trimethylamine-N-oxide reductase (cytochrome c)
MQGWGAPGKHFVSGIEVPGPASSPSVGSVSPSSIINAALSTNFGVRLTQGDRDRPFIERGKLLDCFENPPVEWWFDGDPFYKRTYPMEGKSEVRMNVSTCIPFTASVGDGFRKNKGLRSSKLECNIHLGMYMEDSAYFADILLPITNVHEIDDLKSRGDTFTVLAYQKKPVEPVGEAKTDREALAELAKKLGIYDELGFATSEMDLIKQGYEKSGWQELVSWEELEEKGYFPQPIRADWYDRDPASLAFYNNPDSSPLAIPSGKIEFVSSELMENFPDDKERPPLSRYVRGGPKEEGWTHNEDPHISSRAADYPLVMQSAVREWGHHAGQQDLSLTREIRYIVGPDGYAYSPMWMNPEDATARGIKNHDIVKIYNERGIVLAAAIVEERVISGAVHMDKAGGHDMIDPVKINRGGNPNSIATDDYASKHAFGLVPTSYLCEVAKVTGAEWDEWRETYPDAFARPHHPAYGPFFIGWIDEAKPQYVQDGVQGANWAIGGIE